MIVDGIEHKIPTWTEPETIAYLKGLAMRSSFAVEIGCYLGATAKAMLDANPGLHLWSADHFRAFAFNEEVVRILLGKYISRSQLELVVGESPKVAEILPHMIGKLDFGFVDDGHDIVDLQRDIDSVWPLIKPSGILCGHDWEETNNVAQGVLSRFPIERLFFPCPRVWAIAKE